MLRKPKKRKNDRKDKSQDKSLHAQITTMLHQSVVTGIRKQSSITICRSRKVVNNWFVLLALSLVLSNCVENVFWNTKIISANAELITGKRRIQKKHDKFIDNVDDDDDDKRMEYTISPAPSSSSSEDQPSMTPSTIHFLNDDDDHKGMTESNYTKVQMPLLRINITGNLEQLNNNYTRSTMLPNDIINDWMERFFNTFFKDSSRYRTSFIEINSETVRWNDTTTTKNISTTGKTISKIDIFEVSGYAIFKGTTVGKQLENEPKRVETRKNIDKKSHPSVKEQKKMNGNKKKKEGKRRNRILTMDDMIVQPKVRTTSSITSSYTRRTTTTTTGTTTSTNKNNSSTIPSESELEQIIFAYFSFWGTENLLSFIQQNNIINGWDVAAIQVAVSGTIIYPQISTSTTIEHNNNNSNNKTDTNNNNTKYVESIATDDTRKNKSLLLSPSAILIIALVAAIVIFGIAVVLLLCQRRKSIAIFDDDNSNNNNNNNNNNSHDDDNSTDCTNNIPTGIFDKKNYMKKSNLYPPIQDDDDDDNNNDILTIKPGSNHSIQRGSIGIEKNSYNYTTNNCADNDPDDTDSDSRSATNLYTLSAMNNSPNKYLTTISQYGFVSLLAGSISPRTKLNTILDVEETSTDNEKSTHSRNNNNKLPHIEKSGHSRRDAIRSESDDNSDVVNSDDNDDVDTDHIDNKSILDITKLPVVVDNVASAAAPGIAEDEYILFYTSQNKTDEQMIIPTIQSSVNSSENSCTHQTVCSSSSRVTTSSPVLVPDVPLQLMETNILSSSTIIVQDLQQEYSPASTGTAYEQPESVRRQNLIFPFRNNRRHLIGRRQESTKKSNLISMLQVSSNSKTASTVSESRNDVDNHDNVNVNVNDSNNYPIIETPVEVQPPSQPFLPVQQTTTPSTTPVPIVFDMDDQYMLTHEMSTHSGTRRSRCNSMGSSKVSVGYTTSDCDIVSIADDYSMRS